LGALLIREDELMVVRPDRSVILAAVYDTPRKLAFWDSCVRVNDLDSVGRN
jgi:hypothetical protein